MKTNNGYGILLALWFLFVAAIGVTLVSLVIYILYRVATSI